MAAGDVHIFNEFLEDVGLAIHQLETDTFKCALINNSTVPTEATVIPHFGGTGTTDLSGGEMAGVNGYTSGGEDIGATYSETTGTATFDGATNPSWTQNASGFTTAYYAIIYNDTSVNKECVAYVDLGGPVSLQAGDVSITWAANGLFQVTSTAGT